jgi:hypothetical protein
VAEQVILAMDDKEAATVGALVALQQSNITANASERRDGFESGSPINSYM